MERRRGFAISVLSFAMAVAACSKQPPAEVASASLDAAVPVPAASASGPVASPEDAAVAPVVPASAAPPPEPPVRVKVVTIGMHVGGGPYDEVTKEPMKRSVEPHFADLARCWKHVPKPRQADVGVDLVIEAAGGHAKVSNPRATVEGEGFVPCVVAFFEGIDFLKPKNGRTTVSYSVRFLP